MASALDAWVTEATRCLSRDSAAQVKSEISEHYEASYEAAAQNGARDSDADRVAVAALGDPAKANGQYRDVLLTSSDARLLREGNWEAQIICRNRNIKLALASLPGLALLVSAALLYRGHADISRDLLIGSIAISFLFIVPFLPIYTRSRSRIVRIVKWALLASLPLMIFGADSFKYAWLLCAIWWPMAWIEWRRTVLRRKLPIQQWPKQLYL